MILLGLTWTFGLLTIDDAKVTFQYLFCISNTLQGLFVFIFFGILPSGSRKQLRKVFQRMSKATRRAGQFPVFQAQNSPSDNFGYVSNEMPVSASTNRQTLNNSSLDESISKIALAKSDGIPVEDEDLQKVKVDFNFLDAIKINPNVKRYSIRKNGSKYVTSVELNLKTIKIKVPQIDDE